MITAIIFDLGGVLIDWNPRYLYRKLFNNEAEIDHFLQKICTSDWNEEQDAGRSLKEATDVLIKEFPEHEQYITAYYSRWDEMLGGAIEGTVEIFRKLKHDGRYKLYALTNWSAETFPIAIEKYEFLQWFDGIVVSGTEKDRKPFASFYHLLLKRYQIKTDEVLFIDDNVRNIDAAQAIGIQSIRFVSPEQLSTDLKKLNVI
jgi:2-haloacid dehalogenase